MPNLNLHTGGMCVLPTGAVSLETSAYPLAAGSVRRPSRHLVAGDNMHRDGRGEPSSPQRPPDACHLHDPIQAEPDVVGAGEMVVGKS